MATQALFAPQVGESVVPGRDLPDADAVAYDTQLIKLQALRADLQQAQKRSGSHSSYQELLFQKASRPRLWIDPVTYVEIEEKTGAYRLLRDTEEGPRTLHLAAARCVMAQVIREMHQAPAGWSAAPQTPVAMQSVPVASSTPRKSRMGLIFAAGAGIVLGSSVTAILLLESGLFVR